MERCDKMRVTWLGQAGILLEIKNKKILIDPYLSNSVEKINPANWRRVPVNEDFFKIHPDIIVLTHNHLDHTDPETLEKYFKSDEKITVLASKNSWDIVRKFGGVHNYVMFNRHTVWTEDDITFEAVKAEHSDDFAIGVIIDDGKSRIYITGDTLFNSEIFNDITGKTDLLFLPINGVGNNMNITDAQFFAEKINAKKTVPIHWGMFDELDAENFICKNCVIPQIYQEIKL